MQAEIPDKADLAIVGGGVNGAGLARWATAEGYSVVLFEKGDFASGTSGKSTKLIHGGLRYLEHGHLGLVHESLRERAGLVQSAPHLVKPLSFLLPCYRGDPRPAWKLRAGLSLYDLLAGRGNLNRHSWLSRQALGAMAPSLRDQQLVGAGLYFDAQVDDARLVLDDILWALAHGATCVNYCPVRAVELRRSGEVAVDYHHLSTDATGRVVVRALVLCTGPWTDRVQEQLFGHPRRWLRPTRGTHVVLPEMLGQHAILGSSPSDGRVFFIIPWRGQSLVGTTDVDDRDDPDRTAPSEAEIGYLLEGVNYYFPHQKRGRPDVAAAFAGLRPLVRASAQHASSVSREDRIEREGPVVYVLGGKLTTYRAMARKTLARAAEILGPAPAQRSRIAAWPEPPMAMRGFESWIGEHHLPDTTAGQLCDTYGPAASKVSALLRDERQWREPLCPGRPEIGAQVAYAVLAERAVHLEDVLLRRLGIGYSHERWGEAPVRAAAIMAGLLGWSPAERRAEVSRYRAALHPAPVSASDEESEM